jgi:hypothetical protein
MLVYYMELKRLRTIYWIWGHYKIKYYILYIMAYNNNYLRSQKKLLINSDKKDNNFILFCDDEYDSDVDIHIELNERLTMINNSYIYKKYIGFNKYFVFFILRLLNPLIKIQLIEGTPSKIYNIFYSKDEKYNDCIYIFYSTSTNKVINIRYINSSK